MRYALILTFLAIPPADPPPHEKNDAFRSVVGEGLTVGDVRVKLPEPTFADGQSAEAQRGELARIAGSLRGADEMLQASLSAPHKLILRDAPTEGATLRSGDLYFILRGVELDEFRPEDAFRKLG